jgi:hypothetical protein
VEYIEVGKVRRVKKVGKVRRVKKVGKVRRVKKVGKVRKVGRYRLFYFTNPFYSGFPGLNPHHPFFIPSTFTIIKLEWGIPSVLPGVTFRYALK